MKKLLLVALLACTTTGVFGLDLSAGIGMTVGGFSQSTYYEDYLFDSQKIVETTVPFGFLAYFDATYGLATIGFRMNGNTHTTNTMVDFFGTLINESDDDELSGFLSLSLLGRYPFVLGPVILFPLLGIEYDVILYRRDIDGNVLPTDGLHQFWFKAGAGADFTVYKALYIRPTALLGFKLLNAEERDDIQTAIEADATVARITDFVFEGGVQVGWRF